MAHPIADKTAYVLLIEPQQARRSMLAESFRKMGFLKISSVGTVKDAFGVAEGEATPPDWIITPLLEGTGANALNMLSYFLASERLRQCRVSLIVEEDQRFCLEKAFDLGLYSWHPRFPETTRQMTALMELVGHAEVQDWDDCLTAAHFLREHLRSVQRFEELERFEMKLLTLYPDQPRLVFHLAQALFYVGKHVPAQMVLDRIQGLDPKLDQQVQELAEEIQAAMPQDKLHEREGAAKMLKIETALVADPDPAAANLVVDALKELGVSDVTVAVDGEIAWQEARKKRPDLVIQEWRLPKLSGDLLVQRFRLGGMAEVPIIVFSSLVKNKDRLLLREMGVSEVIEKPMAASRMAGSIMSILKEERRPKNLQAIERQLRVCLAKRDLKGARRLLSAMTVTDRTSELTKAMLEAELTFQEGNVQQAAALASQALFLGGEDVMVLNLLGKIHMKLGQFPTAVKFFDRAQKLSPQNVGRLLFLAEAQLGAEASEAAGDALNQAKALDAGNARVIEAEAKVALASGDLKRAQGVMARVGGTPGIVAFVNNRAVALVNQNRVKESVELYRTALGALPKGAKGVRPIINYNLAMALLRLGDTAGAHERLKESPAAADRGLTAKIQSLTARTAKALATGERVVLNLEPAVMISASRKEGDGESADASSAQIGTMRCHLIFEDAHPDPKAQKLLAAAPGYKARKALQKGA